MKNLLHKNYIYLIVILSISGILFYWYEIRPSQIKKDCYNSIKERSVGVDRYDIFYKSCLNAHGL